VGKAEGTVVGNILGDAVGINCGERATYSPDASSSKVRTRTSLNITLLSKK